MSTPSSGHPPPETAPQEALRLARGSILGLTGGISQRGIRLAITWLLSGALGPAGFGLYALLTTLCELGAAIGPMGTDAAASMYTARHRNDENKAKLKSLCMGSLQIGALGALCIGGLTLTTLLFDPFEILDSSRPLVLLLALAVAASALTAVVNGLLLGARDVSGHAWIQQIGLPALTLAGCVLALKLDSGLVGVFMAYTCARCFTLARSARRAWQHVGDVLTHKEIRTENRWREILDYAVPQGLSRGLQRAVVWADLLMLSLLSTFESVGIYRVALAIAVLVALPVLVSTTVFGPLAAELIHLDKKDELKQALHRMTRWMTWIACPIFIAVYLLGDLLFTPFAAEYAEGTKALSVLLVGRTLQVVLAPAGACLTHGGYARANLVAGTLALGLNIGLNWAWIPQWGLLGAAWASSTALVAWSLGRACATRYLLGVQPFDARSLCLLALCIGLSAGLEPSLGGLSVLPQTGVVLCCLAIWVAASGKILGDAVDRQVLKDLVKTLRTTRVSSGQ